MESKRVCQSCGMPLDGPDLMGTEKDGSKSDDYCKYCYCSGVFTDPKMTLQEMKLHVIKQMEKKYIDSGLIDMAVGKLPYLKRWARKTGAASSAKDFKSTPLNAVKH